MRSGRLNWKDLLFVNDSDFHLKQIVSDAIGPASTITQIGRGSEHVAWLAETSDGPWVLRVRSARDHAGVGTLNAASEVALVAQLRRHGVPSVPEARTIGPESEIVCNLARIFET